MPHELRHSDLARHIKEPQNNICCLNYIKIDKIWKLRLCFTPKVTWYFLYVGRIVSFLFVFYTKYIFLQVFVTVREHSVWQKGAMACLTQQQ